MTRFLARGVALAVLLVFVPHNPHNRPVIGTALYVVAPEPIETEPVMKKFSNPTPTTTTTVQERHSAPQAASRSSSRPRPRPATTAPPRKGSHRGYATAKECTSMVEHRGRYDRSTNPGHFGRYQFSPGTWKANGGNPATWGHASPQEQDEVFERTWNSPGGSLNWTPYNGC